MKPQTESLKWIKSNQWYQLPLPKKVKLPIKTAILSYCRDNLGMRCFIQKRTAKGNDQPVLFVASTTDPVTINRISDEVGEHLEMVIENRPPVLH